MHTELEPHAINLMSMYQYFIVNTDYSVLRGEGDEPCCHNARLFESDAGYLVVPYDFDLAGIINTTYAAPPVGLKIDKVTQRLYRGFCVNNEFIPQTLKKFTDNKVALYQTFNDERIRKNTRRRMLKFIDNFYKIAENPKRVEKRLVKKCR